MSKFKVGDKIRLVSKSNTHSNFGYLCDMLKTGNIATIEEVIGEDRIRIKEGSFTYHPDDFELVDEWLTPGQALDAHIEGKELIDDDGYVWKPSRHIDVHVFKQIKLKIKTELEWEVKTLELPLSETLYANENTLEIFDYEITKETALKIADFIIETYRGDSK